MIHLKLNDILNRLFCGKEKYTFYFLVIQCLQQMKCEKEKKRTTHSNLQMSWPRSRYVYSGNIIQPCYCNLECLQALSFRWFNGNHIFKTLPIAYTQCTQANNNLWMVSGKYWIVRLGTRTHTYVYVLNVCIHFNRHLFEQFYSMFSSMLFFSCSKFD